MIGDFETGESRRPNLAYRISWLIAHRSSLTKMGNWPPLVAIAAVSFATGILFDRYVLTPPLIVSRSGSSSDSDDDSEDEGVDIDSRSLNSVGGDVRMTLIVRQDLKMGKGKAAAQCSHATIALYKKIMNPSSVAFNPEMVRRWEMSGQAKITLQVSNQEDMDMLFAGAMELGVNAYIVHDAGRTQIAAGSATVLGLGPAPKAVLDQITGDLRLY